MADGKVSLPYKQFLGYEKGEDGLPKIAEKEAEVIRLIYKLFLVKDEIKWRKASPGHHSGTGCFSGKIICGECGGVYGIKVWHSTSKYRRTIWQCNGKFKNAVP
ncbi:MAG TPA: zinc ribbon domain-containing protein [Ruminiclostridium sp.]|nr:zinc ribbon domain-containing protein [Ruminiclostridium sp.]